MLNKSLLSLIRINMFLLLVLILSNQTILSQEPDCFDINRPSGITCSGWQAYPYSEIYLDAFPNCPVRISLTVDTCINNNCIPPKVTKEIRIGSIDWDWDDPLCMGLTQYLIPGYPFDFSDIDEVRLMGMFSEIKLKLSIMVFDEFYDNLNVVDKDLYKCDHWSNVTCPFMVTFSEAVCKGICFRKIRDPRYPVSHPNYGKYVV